MGQSRRYSLPCAGEALYGSVPEQQRGPLVSAP
jgi:hypothetical protein